MCSAPAEPSARDTGRPGPSTGRAVALEHLSGAARGSLSWIAAPEVVVGCDALGQIRVVDARGATLTAVFARLRCAEGSCELETCEGASVWVNGKPVERRRLEHGDVIEFGETGPLSRLRLFDDRMRLRPSLWEIADDCVAYLRTSRKPLIRRVPQAAADFARRSAREATVAFRVFVLVALAALTALAYWQYRLSVDIEERVASGAEELEGLAAALGRARQDALRRSDLSALREELGRHVSSNIERLEALERRSTATARVISASLDRVALLQGSYGLREPSTGRMMRHVLSDDGLPMIMPTGQPFLTLEGDGPVAEVQFTGTGFFMGAEGVLVTNRHVARPWEGSVNEKSLMAAGLRPEMIRFLAFVPRLPEPFDVELRHVSESGDLAVLRVLGDAPPVAGLKLAAASPGVGDEVIVMGYPTGLRSILAQSGPEFIAELEEAGDLDFWTVSSRLAEAGQILPLASRGIVGKVGREAIVYDAETTHGGSGGPVLDQNGEVVAINTAVLPEFGGSNLGIPVAKLRLLLEEARTH